MELGVASRGEIRRMDPAVLEQKAGDGAGACGGQLPVGCKLSVMDGDVVGVSLDADVRVRQ